MAAKWPILQSQLTRFLQKKEQENSRETARKIANLYHDAVRTAMPIIIPGATPIGGNKKLIEDGFEASFKLAFNLGGVPNTPAQWTPAALGVVAYWTGLKFNPAVPAPGYVPGVNNIVVFPGVPPAPQIWSAMNARKESLVASKLVTAFVTHLQSISGVFTGNPIGSPSPVPFPWVGAV